MTRVIDNTGMTDVRKTRRAFFYQQLTQTKATAAATKSWIKGAAAKAVCSKLFRTIVYFTNRN